MAPKQPLQRWIIDMRLVDKRLERQRIKLKNDEAKMMKEVRTALENDDMDSARLFAKDIARTRKMMLNLQSLRSKVKGISFKLESAATVQAIGGDLRGLVRSLAKVNRQLAIPQMEQLLLGMENQMTQLDMTTETIEEGFDSITEGGVEEDAEANQIIEELQVARAGAPGLPDPADTRTEDINQRLERLKGSDKK